MLHQLYTTTFVVRLIHFLQTIGVMIHHPRHWKSQLLKFYERNEKAADLCFFLGGFVFDIFTLSQVDDLFSIVQQIVYLLILACLFYYDFLFTKGLFQPSSLLKNLWGYRHLALHFILGSLLSVYSLLFLKSSSVFSSIVFVVTLMILMILNELKVVQQSVINIKIGLYVICVFAFFSLLMPIIFGFVGWIPFTMALSATVLFFSLFFRQLEKRTQLKKELYKGLLAPTLGVLSVLSIFYFMGWIPPVPIAIQQMGIYQNIKVEKGSYEVKYSRPYWKFWQSGAQDFIAEPGDQIVFFFQIFSPKRFSDQVFVKWSQKLPKVGWKVSDRIPIRIVGGRQSGFRGYATKNNFSDGSWRVQVETENGHEIGRLHFDVTKQAQVTQDREWVSEVF